MAGGLSASRSTNPAVFAKSCNLAQQHSARLLCRSLDILHVACALDLACDRFVSGDDRQLRLARATGLKVVDITAPVSRIRRPRRAP